MNTEGHQFLESLAAFPPGSFESRFSRTAARLGLGSSLNQTELDLLYEAAFYARLCNISFNGRGGCAGKIKPEREGHRRNLETEFMTARDEFHASTGWQALPASQKIPVQELLLSVSVVRTNLAD
jgi:hypothetical protein